MLQTRKRMHLYILQTITVVMALALSGCTVGPDYTRPETAADDKQFANQPNDWPRSDELVPAGRWWESFKDPYINELVTEAVENNNDLKVAAARVLESHALLAQAFGKRLPDISYSASRTQARILPGADPTKTYAQGLSITWVADLFGKLRRTERAAVNDLLAERANQEALVHSIIAQAVRSRVEISTQQKLVSIAQANIESRQQTLDIVERRYSSGLVTSLDLYLAKENYASAAATEPATKQNLELAFHTLDVLLGRTPARTDMPENTLPERPTLKPVPMSLPAALLDRRPDVRAAELKLTAATERVGVSIAELFPDLTLSGTAGYTANKYRFASATENQIYSGIIALAAPIYKGGRLKEGVKAARARAQQSAAAYANTVLKAIREVEDALVKEKYLTETVTLLHTRVENALKSETLARERYSSGLEPLLVVLETERRRIIAENELAASIRSLFNARIDLFLALGGDWQIEYKNNDTNNKTTE